MSCERFEELMAESLYGELDEAVERELEAHVAECAACRAELDALRATLETMSRRQPSDPGPAYWDGYWGRLSARMEEERVVAPARGLTPLFGATPARWAYRVAAAAAILAIGVFAGRTFFAPGVGGDLSPIGTVAEHPAVDTPAGTPADETPQQQVAENTNETVDQTGSPVPQTGGNEPGVSEQAVADRGQVAQQDSPQGTTPPAMDAPMTVMPASSERAMRYIEKSQMLLIALVNSDEDTPDGYASDFGAQQQRSRALVDEADDIKAALDDPKERRLRELVADLQKILVQIANLESGEDMDAVEFIRSRVNKHDVLLKINLEQMRHGTDVDGSASGEAQRSNSQRSI